ncbi:unnamed protein product [Dracunculus medinensis]|uniref:VM domain-containing protein n=1 Tax=Dracunculus medinensis TaxID=318479 RepID=A0A0N4URV7_DRAME|nr:unnamed protein product [Dracunculus medinensis]
MNFIYLPLLFFISCVSADDVSIKVCSRPLLPQAPAVGVPGVGVPGVGVPGVGVPGVGVPGVGVPGVGVPGVGVPGVGVPGVGAAAEVMNRPTVDPNLCFDLDPKACSEIFKLHTPDQTIPAQLNP